MPLKLQDNVKGYIVFLDDEMPTIDESTKGLIRNICETAAKTVEGSICEQKVREHAFDNLTTSYHC